MTRYRKKRRRKLAISQMWSIVIVSVVGVGALGLAAAALVPRTPTPSAPREIVATPEPTEQTPQVVSILGDSYTAGSRENTDGRTWPTLLPSELNIVTDLHAVGGVGYTRGDGDSIPSQASRVRKDSDLVLLFGSRNDFTTDPGVTQEAVTSAVEAVRAAAPDAAIVVVGFPWVEPEPGIAVLSTRDALARAATETSVPFVDALTESWLLEEGLIGTDGVHPTDAGHDVIAARMAEIIAAHLPTS